MKLDRNFSRTRSGVTESYLTDALGSTLELRDAAQNQTVEYTYDSYGGNDSSVASTNVIKYTGREQDLEDLYYYRNRYYKPSVGQFISEDPIGLAGGSNLYIYVGGNPVNLVDRDGLRGMRGVNYGSSYGRPGGYEYGGKLPPMDPFPKGSKGRTVDDALQQLPENVCDYWPAYCMPRIPMPPQPWCRLVCPNAGNSCNAPPKNGLPSLANPSCFEVCTEGPFLKQY